MKKNIIEIISNKRLLLKGDIKTNVGKYSLKERDYKGERFKDISHNLFEYTDILAITKPEIISEIHERFLKAGIDIIATTTLQSNRFHLQKLGLEDITYELNMNAAKLARSKVEKYSSITWDKPRYAAGALPSLPSDTDFELAVSLYSEQIKALLAGKVDFIYFVDFDNKNALDAAFKAYNDLMTRRKKTGSVLISVKNKELLNLLADKQYCEQYQNVQIIAGGMLVNNDFYDDFDTLKKFAKDFDGNIFCPLKINNGNADDDACFEQVKLVAEVKNIKILGLNDKYNTDFVEKIKEIFV